MDIQLKATDDDFIYEVYNKRKKVEEIDIRDTEDRYKVLLICQEVSKGNSLAEYLNLNWSFTELEFFSLLDSNPEWKNWLNTANNVRNKMIIEITMGKIKELDFESEKRDDVIKLLRGIQEVIKKNEADEGLKSITYNQVYQPKAVKNRGWGLK